MHCVKLFKTSKCLNLVVLKVRPLLESCVIAFLSRVGDRSEMLCSLLVPGYSKYGHGLFPLRNQIVMTGRMG